jgi:hypothetical protein
MELKGKDLVGAKAPVVLDVFAIPRLKPGDRVFLSKTRFGRLSDRRLDATEFPHFDKLSE